MSPLRAVLFDRDETLAWTDKTVYREAALWLAERYGLDPRAAGETMAQTWAELGNNWWDLRTEQDEDAYWQAYGDELTARLGIDAHHAADILHAYPYERFMKPVAGARDVLLTVRARGLKIGVLSNTLPSIDRTLAELGLGDLVDTALATCTLGVHKPEAQAFVLAAQALGALPEEVLFIDDKLENVEAARAAGMRAAQIDLAGGAAGALHRLGDVLELLDAD